ncbi:MAG: SIS domain-containing protein [Bacteroidales bacterium]|nr:SIS domain-containing protein [Bacteroidales bacterium]
MNNIDFIKKKLNESIDLKKHILNNESILRNINEAANLIIDAFLRNKKLYIAGNGGSAADAQHIAAEFTGKFSINRKPLPAEAINVNTSYLTAVANDFGYENVFSRYLSAFAIEGDIFWGISTSGKSRNVLNAFETAHSLKMRTIAMVGDMKETLPEYLDVIIIVPSIVTPRIQEVHITISHIICEIVDNFFK